MTTVSPTPFYVFHSGEQNMSVIVAPVLEGFSLQSMGSPDKVALQFLQSVSAVCRLLL